MLCRCQVVYPASSFYGKSIRGSITITLDEHAHKFNIFKTPSRSQDKPGPDPVTVARRATEICCESIGASKQAIGRSV